MSETPQAVLEKWLGNVGLHPDIREAIRAVLAEQHILLAANLSLRLRDRSTALVEAEAERDIYRSIVKGVHGALTDSATVVVPGSLEADLYAPVMQLVAERDELRAEVERLRRLNGEQRISDAKTYTEMVERQRTLREKAEAALREAYPRIPHDRLQRGIEVCVPSCIACKVRAALRDTAEPRTILDESASVPPEMWNRLRDKGQP